MTAPTLTPDASRCPDCRGPLAGPGRCPSCGLALTGPAAARLWQVDRELLELASARDALVREREGLLQVLRASPELVPPQPSPAGARREQSPEGVQNLLLLLGGLLLAGAALVFTAVTYERLGAAGRAGVLALLTLLAAAAAPALRRRGLRATAETLAAVALTLAALDAYGLRTLGLAADASPLRYAAGAAAGLALCGAAYARLVPLRVTRTAPVVLAQLPVPLLLLDAQASAAAVGAALAAVTAADLALLAAGRRALPAPTLSALRACAVPVGLVALQASSGAAASSDPRPGAAALVACAAVLAGASLLARDVEARLLSGGSVVVLAAAAAALAADAAATGSTPSAGGLALGGVALVAALAVALLADRLPERFRTGTAGGALVTAAAAVLVVAPHLDGAVAPLAWALEPWTLEPWTLEPWTPAADVSAREALPTAFAWTGTALTPAVLLVAALAVGAAGPLVGRRQAGAGTAALLAITAVALLPLGLDLPLPVALAALLLAGAGCAAAAHTVRARAADVAGALAGGAALLTLLAAGWSLAAQPATLVVLPVAALVTAGLATLPRPEASVAVAGAGLLAASELAAVGAAAGLARDQVGALLVLAVAALALLAPRLDAPRRSGADAAAALTGAAALGLTADTVGWLSWTLLGLGLVALATALRPDRSRVAALGGLLLAASSWVRLDDAGITAPEPYVVPAALVALLLGARRRRTAPDVSSWSAYGPGLTLALVPSLVTSLDDASLVRPLLLGLAALVVLLVGAAQRLRAPLVVGATVLAVDALHLLAPYAQALPRWLSLGTAGALLVLVGATYEQRRRDVGRLRARYDGLA